LLLAEEESATEKLENGKAMGAHGNAELLKGKEDVMIYKRLLQLTTRVTKQGKKAQKKKS
jgi:hypothetical protein